MYMINWISPFNYDFAIAAIPIQIILLVFYGFRRNLPIRQSSCFWLVMAANLVMTSADIISCEMNEIWTEFPLWVMYAINHAYFMAFIIRGWSLFAYTAESTHAYKSSNILFRVITDLPAVTALVLIVSTPWTSAIYTIAEDGYHNCSMYPIIYFSTYFYIIVSILMVILNWHKLRIRMQAGLLSFNLLLLFGIIIRKQFYHMLVTSYFSILSIIIIFLTSENPDLYRDGRTRLLNRDALDMIGRDYWEKKIPFNLLILRIENYESSKSIYGIPQVNKNLKSIACWLRKNYPQYFAFYVRNGCFLLLIRGHSIHNTDKFMEKWKNRYDDLQKKDMGIVPIKASVMLLPESVIKANFNLASSLARYALNHAYSENHKGNFIFSDEMVEGMKKQKSIETAVKNGLKEHRFEVYFQPIFSNRDNKVVGAEALARLNDPELGFIPPPDFIQAAEKNGDIMEIGRQIFENICVFLKNIDTKKLGIQFININLSPAQCFNNNLASEFTEIAEKHGIPMNTFDFEVTESMIEDYDMIKKQISGLQETGARLALDDFGTGASNISSLMHLSIHAVKIDMTFVHSYFDGKADFLPDLIRLFKNSDLRIVAEGIETKEMKEKIAEMGCEYEQGYYFARPLPPEEFVKFMTEKN